MADAVSKLYAEIGFKVNESGLKQAQKMLSEFAIQMSELNELTKKQASIYGVFSKERAKQDTEREKQATEQRKAETQRIKQSIKEVSHQQQMERMARKEEMQDKRFQQKEQEHLWRMEERASKNHQTNMAKYARQGAKSLLRVVRGTAKIFASATQSMFKNVILPNLSGAVNVRDFMMYSGTNLSTLQGIQERFASVGSNMTREDIMGELSSVMENITKIRFGEGKLGGFKLGGIQAFAHKKDVSGILNTIENATSNVSNQDLVYLLDELGFSGQRWLPYFRARQKLNAKMPRLNEFGQQQLVEANKSLNLLVLGLQRSGELLTAKFAPVIEKISDRILVFLNKWVSSVNTEKIGRVFDRILSDFTGWLETLDAEDIEKKTKSFFNAIGTIVDVLVWAADKIGEAYSWGKTVTKSLYAAGNLMLGRKNPDAVKNFNEMPERGGLLSYINNYNLEQNINGVKDEQMANEVKESGKGILRDTARDSSGFEGTMVVSNWGYD